MWNVILFGTAAGLLGAALSNCHPLAVLAAGAACGAAFVGVEAWLYLSE